MKKHWRIGAAAAGACLLASPAAVAAADTAAPSGQSSSVAAQVQGLIAISKTGATSGATGGGGTATVLEIGGQPVVGGSAKSGETKDGAIYDTKATPLGRLQVAPWHAKSSAGHSESEAAVLRLMLLDADTVNANVLQSSSSADWTEMLSKGRASSDGATVGIGGKSGLNVVLLHTEADSTAGSGKTYVASINGNEILTSKDAKSCTLAVPGVFGIACLQVAGGVGKVDAAVADATVGSAAQNLRAQVLQASGTSGQATTPSVLGLELDRDVATGSMTLPATGATILASALFALAMIGVGAALVGAQRVPAVRTVRV